MKKKITILPGDGIGKEVTASGKKVLEQIADCFGHEFVFDYATIGHEAIEATGNPLPDETLKKLKNCDAILFGAVGHPKYDNDPSAKVRPEQGLLKMRKELGLYANLRPIKLFDELLAASSIKPEILKGADILFFRELTGDVYFGERGRKDENKTAYDTMIYSHYEVERIAHKAFKAAQTRSKKLTSVGDTVGLYEPIHGSAHDITGKGIANPLASILSAALLLDISFGLKEESDAIIKAVAQTLKEGYRTRDIADGSTLHEKILGTEVMGNVVCNQLRMQVSVNS